MKLQRLGGNVPLWMACYVLLGFVQSGLLPVILPLASRPGPTAGLSYAAFAVMGLAAPLIGAWSDRHRRHRLTLAGGLAFGGIALLFQALPGGLAQHLVLAAAIGLGVSAAITVATMFIVEVLPKESWDGQISALQACIGGGQLIGLLVAGLLGVHHPRATFVLGGAVLLLAVPLALALAPDPVVKVDRQSLPSRPARGGDSTPTGPHRTLHGVTWRGLSRLGHSGLVWFLAAWLISYTATNGLSVMFAVAMIRDYHVSAVLPTTAYAVGVGCSLLLYRTVGRWDVRLGPWRVLSTGLALRALLLACMVGLTALKTDATTLLILISFATTQIIWPLLSVASNSLAVTLDPGRQAEIAGLLNAVTAIGATIGGILGGVLLRQGFMWLCVAVLAALLVALLLAWHPAVHIENPGYVGDPTDRTS